MYLLLHQNYLVSNKNFYLKATSNEYPHGKFRSKPEYQNNPKYWDRQAWANSADPDQMPQNVASDLGLHCLLLIPHFLDQKKTTRGSWWPCNAHLSNIALWEPDLELIKANILIKVQNDYINK